jgi:hypothetical protein
MSVHIEGRLLGFIDRLEDHLKIGDQVTVDLAVNAADASGHPYIQGSPGRYVARAVFKERCLIQLLHKLFTYFCLPKVF